MDHDQRFKVLLQEYFDEFLRLFFPTWAERLDATQVEWLATEAFSDPPRGDVRHLDLVARLPARLAPMPTDEPSPWLVLVHLEVEARDAVASLHEWIFDYWWHLRVKHRLPVLPIGLYLRVGVDGVGWSEYVESFWEHELVRLRYAYVGLPALDAFAYLHRDSILAAALAALMRVPTDRRAVLKAEAEQRVAVSRENDYRKRLLKDCIDSYLSLEGAQLEEYNQLMETTTYEEARVMAQTTFEKGVEQGIQIAQTTFEKGVERGQRDLLWRLIQQRFGPLPETVRQRFDACPANRLDDLTMSVLTAASLRDLGLSDE